MNKAHLGSFFPCYLQLFDVPTKMALFCELHCKRLQDFIGESGETVAINIGCSAGGLAYQLAEIFQNVLAVD